MATAPDPSAPGHVLRNRGVVGIGLRSFVVRHRPRDGHRCRPWVLRSISAPAAALGAIEGIADAALSASKVAGGVIADRPDVERTTVTAGGYAITADGHGAFAVATVWPMVAAARAVSWIARGGKAPGRDGLLAGSVQPHQLGRAFVERAMDSLGAIAGPLSAAPLIVSVGYRWLFAISIIPGLLAAVAVLTFVREVPRAASASAVIAAPMRALLRTLGPFRRLVVGVGLYGLGNFSATLLILEPRSFSTTTAAATPTPPP